VVTWTVAEGQALADVLTPGMSSKSWKPYARRHTAQRCAEGQRRRATGHGMEAPGVRGHKGIERGRVPAGLHGRPGEESLGPGLVLEVLGAVELCVGDDENVAELTSLGSAIATWAVIADLN